MRKLAERPEIKIFLLALAVQLAAFFLLFYIAEIKGLNFAVLSGDANAYRILAENIVKHRVFSVSQEAPFFPESFRSPGFPFFLAPLYFLFGNWLIILFILGILSTLVPVLLYFLGKKVDTKAAFVAATIFIFEPTRLFLANNLLTDTLFTIFLFLSVLFLFNSMQNYKRVFFAGSLLGVAALLRPIAVFLPLLFLPFISLGRFNFANGAGLPAGRMGLGGFMKLSAFFLVGFILIIFPWSLRNKLIFNSWQISSVASSNLANYNVPEFLKYKDDPRKEEILAELKKLDEGIDPLKAHSLYRIKEMNNFSKKYIIEDPLGYLKFHLVKTIPFFVTDGWRDIARSLGFLSAIPPNLSTLIALGRWQDVFRFVKSGGTDFLLFLPGFSFWFLTSALAAAAVIREAWSKSSVRFFVFFFAALILYFALLTGPVSNARYRFPVSGFIIFLAVFCLFRSGVLFSSFRAKEGIFISLNSSSSE